MNRVNEGLDERVERINQVKGAEPTNGASRRCLVTDLFSSQVERTPDNIAIAFSGRDLTYAQLASMSARLANFLVERGIGPEDFVAVVMDHSPEQIAAMLGVIEAGAAYIPMEPTFPRERINNICRQAHVRCVLTQRAYAETFDDRSLLVFEGEDLSGFPDVAPDPRANGDNAMYALFTSGTTGEPKGVVVEQRNVWNYVRAFSDEFHPAEHDRMLQNSVCTFDIFVEEVYPILCSGGTLVIATEDEKASAEALVDLCDRESVTMVTGFPYLLSDINRLRVPKALRLAISGGDTLRKEHVDRLVGKVAVYNTYGPTETCVCCAYYRYSDPSVDARTVPIGTSILGCKVRVLDRDLRLVSPGEMGEICISGAGVSRGYLGSPEETAAVFVDDPFEPGRMYLSGDLGILRPDGTIEFVRRKDDQVMIGGRRVEPGEVESVMYRYPGVSEAVVVPQLDADGYPFLVAYLVAADSVCLGQLQGFMSQYLPDFMIPSYFERVGEMPRTSSGKIDRKALPEVVS